MEADSLTVMIGQTIEELPFGVSTNATTMPYYPYLILPMSAAPEDVTLTLSFNVSNYTEAKLYMDSTFGENTYNDYRVSQERNRTLLLLINVFCYGFIILISLICVANVFNTISTNIALRRRDFGMLRSVGFRERDILRMMNFECMTYGAKSLVIGLPVGLVLTWGICRLAETAFAVPWNVLTIAAGSVFVVVFATMFYAMSKLRKDNPIDAIRMENT